jgi:hypothetical protein
VHLLWSISYFYYSSSFGLILTADHLHITSCRTR